jgi:Fe(3+) dicitrate transport protein
VSASAGDIVTRTRPDGRFGLVLPESATTVRVTADGYRAVQRDIAATSERLDFVLEPAPYRLAAVSVTGRTRADLDAIPGAATVVGPAVLRERAPISVMDALRTVPGVQTADEDPFGLNLNVGIRGLPPRRSSRTLLLEDGVPILLGPYGDPSMHYAPPVEALDRIEVLKGSSQIMYGPQTTGGVVNFVTRRPPLHGTRASLVLGGGSHGYRNAGIMAGTAHGAGGVALDYMYREGTGVRTEQGHRLHNAILSGLLTVGSGQSILAKASVWNEASNISETGLTQAEFEEDPYSLPFSAAGRFDVRRYGALLMHEIERGRVVARTRAYASHTDRVSWRQSGESEERIEDDDYADDFNCAPAATTYEECGNQGRPREYTVAGIEPRVSIDVATSMATLDFGMRLHQEHARRRQFTGDTPMSREDDAVLTRDNDITTNALAAFARSRLQLGALMLSPGLRVEHIRQEIRNRFPGSEAAMDAGYTQYLPGIGATMGVADGATLFAGIHRGFAPPRPADVYSPQPGQPVVLVDPETSWNWEAGARLQPHPGVSAEATFFRMDFGNQIIEAPAGTGQRFTNGGSTLHQGVEMAAELRPGLLQGTRHDVALSVAWTFIPVARFREDDERPAIAGNRLPYAARSLASASATYMHRTGITAGASLEHTGEQYADAANRHEPAADGQSGLLPAYTVTHAFASYDVPRAPLRLRASVRNLFDRVYITQRNEGIYTGMRRLLRAEVQWTLE